MANRKKPLVIVTRKLPDSVETRMRELFDAQLNLDDKPMTPGRARRSGEERRRAGADRHRPHRRLGAEQGRRQAQADRQFRQRRRQYRRRDRAQPRHHRHQHAGRAHRGHRRHDHGADPRGAAPARRRRRRAERATSRGPAGRRPGCSATASGASGSASSAWAGSARRWRAAPAPSACRSTITTAAASPAKIEEELTATYWESLDQMLARMDIISVNCPHTPATYHLLSARRLKLHPARGLSSSTPRAAR